MHPLVKKAMRGPESKVPFPFNKSISLKDHKKELPKGEPISVKKGVKEVSKGRRDGY